METIKKLLNSHSHSHSHSSSSRSHSHSKGRSSKDSSSSSSSSSSSATPSSSFLTLRSLFYVGIVAFSLIVVFLIYSSNSLHHDYINPSSSLGTFSFSS